MLHENLQFIFLKLKAHRAELFMKCLIQFVNVEINIINTVLLNGAWIKSTIFINKDINAQNAIKTKVTPIVNLIDKGCCYTKDVKNTVVNHYEKEHISYGRMSDFINEQYNLSFSRKTIFNCNDNESDDYLKQKEELIAEKIEK